MNQHTAKKIFTATHAARSPWLGTGALLLAMASGCMAEQGSTGPEAGQPTPGPSEPGAPAAPSPESPPPAGDVGIATSRRVAWQVDMPNVEPGIWEYAVMFAEVDALPAPGVTPTWQPRASIELRFHQVNFNTSTDKVATLIARQAATVTDVAADGFTLRTADGSSVWLGQEMAFLNEASEATMAAFDDQASWALTGVGWCSAMDGDGYDNQDVAFYAIAELSGEVYDKLTTPAVETSYGLVKDVQAGDARILCVLDAESGVRDCQLTVTTTAIAAVGEQAAVLAGSISGDAATTLQHALLAPGETAATFEGLELACAAGACSYSWSLDRAAL